MYIKSLYLHNFRCFEDLELHLDRHLTVLVGENASGKTAIVEGLATGLGAFFLGVPDAHTTSGSIVRSDVRVVSYEVKGAVDLRPQFPCDVGCYGQAGDDPLVWVRSLSSARSRTTRASSKAIREHAKELREHVKEVTAAVSTGKPVRLPVLAYYGTQRLWRMKKRTEASQDLRNRFAGYWDCLDPASNQKHLVDWMRWQTYAKLQSRKQARQIDAVETAVVSFLGEVDRFFYDVAREQLTIHWKKRGGYQPFDQLSDGYRNLLAMIADIAWRAVVLNPADGKDAPARAEGVVLVDEIDLHLHPRWQRQVLPSLLKAFPRLQFVVTTHSPQVVGSCRAESIRVLDGTDQPLRVGHALGLDSNTVLELVFGARSRDPKTLRSLKRLAELIHEERWREAGRVVAKLEPTLGRDDTDLVRARWEIEFAGEA